MDKILFVGQGITLTLGLLFGGICIGLILGCLLAILRYNNYCKFLINSFVSIVRGTPLILQLGLIFFGLPSILGIKIDVISAGILTFGLNSAAYMTEIIRSGINSVPKSQFEAAQVLQIPTYNMWKSIILPQVIRNITPSLTNEVISLLKETALISTIGGMDIMRHAQVIAAEEFSYFLPLCIAGGYYYSLVLLIEYIGRKIEKRGRYAQH